MAEESTPVTTESIERARSVILSLSQILGPLPDHLSSSETPSLSLLNDISIASRISRCLRQSDSGAGDDNLCRWLYNTFQSTDPSLQLIVLHFLPTIAELYLSRSTAHRHYQPLAGFEAVLLALYAHETMAREGNAVRVNIPNLYAPSTCHEAKVASLKSNKNVEDPIAATALISAALEPHGTVRSTKRARIVGVALELYYSKISHMPVESKVEVCQFASVWAGDYKGEEKDEEKREGEKGERIPLPWELLVPTLRILGNCLLGQTDSGKELKMAAMKAVERLHKRAMHDMNTNAMLATRSLMRLGMMEADMIVEPSLPGVYSEVSESEPAKVAA